MPIKMYIYLFVEQLIYVFICDNNSYFPYFLFCCKTANMINNLFPYLYINLYTFTSVFIYVCLVNEYRNNNSSSNQFITGHIDLQCLLIFWFNFPASIFYLIFFFNLSAISLPFAFYLFAKC